MNLVKALAESPVTRTEVRTCVRGCHEADFVMHVFNPSRSRRVYRFEDSLLYKSSSRTAEAIQIKLLSKTKPTKQTGRY